MLCNVVWIHALFPPVHIPFQWLIALGEVVGGLLHQCVRLPNLLPVGGLEGLIFVNGSVEGLATNWWYMLVFRALLGISEAAFGPGRCFRNLFFGDGSN